MYEYHGQSINEKLQHWAMTHQPGDNMLYKDSFWKFIVFIRDKIINDMFFGCEWNNKCQDIDKIISGHYDIVGSHNSKSIELPVIKINYKGAEIIFRYNFYDYEVSVISEKELNLPEGLFDFDTKYFYFQGFPEEYKINVSYSKSKNKFAVIINPPCDYNFYTFMFLLKNELDK